MNKLKDFLRKGNRNLLYVVGIAGIIILCSTISIILETATTNYTKDKAAQLEEKEEGGAAAEEKDGEQHIAGTADLPDATEPEETQGEPEGKGDRDAEDANAANEKKEAFDRSLADYRQGFGTEIKGNGEDIAAFLDGEEEAFKLTVADYVFSTFGDVAVEAVNIKESISAEENKVTYRITIEMGGDELPYICTNNKDMGFFSLYSPQELQ